ncbi:MAG: hypothetical protein NC092_11310 [Butyrivibrio sp.]|nr:hypothetical protein [Muribaculum sp.]MCM1553269.1 hypothetical protein [Butyrivibrio sp.]
MSPLASIADALRLLGTPGTTCRTRSYDACRPVSWLLFMGVGRVACVAGGSREMSICDTGGSKETLVGGESNGSVIWYL